MFFHGHSLAEEEAIRMRTVNLDVTSGAILVSQGRLVVEVGGVRRTNLVGIAMTFETELSDG